MRAQRFLLPGIAVIAAVVIAVAFWLLGWFMHPGSPIPSKYSASSPPHAFQPSQAASASAPAIQVRAHHLLLLQGPQLQVYIPWLLGQMLPTQASRNPSFDDPDSFVLAVHKGVIYVPIEGANRFLAAGKLPNAPLTHISLAEHNGQIQLHGTAHKFGLPLPVTVEGTLASAPHGQVRFHLTHISLLKIPVHWLLSGLHLQLDDLMQPGQPGISVAGNDVSFDTTALLPAPHIQGDLTSVRLATGPSGPAIQAIYGGAAADPENEEQWHNFLQFSGGTLGFGNLTMHPVDLIMIDASKDPWFSLDLVHYQAQLVQGITRTTPQAGLQIFMPDLDDLPPGKPAQTVTMQWLHNKRLPPPGGIPYK